MKIGLSPLQGQASFEETLRECEQAEAAGFDSIWLGEHHSHPLLYPAPLIGLAAVAGRTRKIRLGTGVLLLPLYHPLRVAEEAAMVDVISGGRLILGIGAGYAPEEFAAFGYSIKERGSRLEESALLLQRLWTEENVTHHGRHFHLDNVTVAPRPLQHPRPPFTGLRGLGTPGLSGLPQVSMRFDRVCVCIGKPAKRWENPKAMSPFCATSLSPAVTERPLAQQAIRLSEHLRGCISDGPILSSNALQAGSRLNDWLKTGLSWATPKAALRISSGFKQSWVRTISSAGSRFREFPAISAPSRSASLRAR